MSVLFRLRRDTEADWVNKNPILDEGEPGLESDTGRFKMGDGTTRWTELKYFSPEKPSIDDEDGPSFALLYENAKV